MTERTQIEIDGPIGDSCKRGDRLRVQGEAPRWMRAANRLLRWLGVRQLQPRDELYEIEHVEHLTHYSGTCTVRRIGHAPHRDHR